MTNVLYKVRSHCSRRIVEEIIQLVVAQISLGALGNLAKIEPHVLKEKYFFCIVCDISTFYHNCTFCGTWSIYFLSSFALHFILLYSIQISKWFYWRLLKLHSVREDVPFVFYQMARCSYHNCIHPSPSSSCIVLESYPWLPWILYWNTVLHYCTAISNIVLEYCTGILY